MALIQCHECSKEISSEAVTCPQCGAKIKMSGSKAGWLLVPVLLIGGFLLLGAVTSDDSSKERSQVRSGIELCWKEYERKSNDPSQKRFIAGACERMEADFKSKYGVNP